MDAGKVVVKRLGITRIAYIKELPQKFAVIIIVTNLKPLMTLFVVSLVEYHRVWTQYVRILELHGFAELFVVVD